MLLKLSEDGKDISVLFDLNTDRKDTSGLLSVFSGELLEEISSVPNDVVISLFRFLNSPIKDLSFKYQSLTPYWFFHDLAHAIYTSDLFIPNIIDISIDREQDTYLKGIELARKAKLPEEYIQSVKEIKAFI